MIAPIHYTTLRHMAQSPAHFKAHYDARLDRRELPEELMEVGEPLRASLPALLSPTPAMRIGIATHSMVLLGRADFVVWDGRRAGKDWEAFDLEHTGQAILSRTEYDIALAASDAAARNPDLSRLVGGTLFEQREMPLTWQVDGRACAGRLDAVLSHDMGYVFELKTSSSAAPAKVAKHALSMGYHAQLAWYQHAARENGMRVPDAYMAVVETKPPFPVSVFKLTPRLLEEGERLWRTWLASVRACEEEGVWPEYTNGIVALDTDDRGPELVFADDG